MEALDTAAGEMAEFAVCVREARRPEMGGPEAVRALTVILAAIESHNSDGKLVETDW